MSTKTCRCGAIFRPEKVPAEDDHGRVVAFVTSPWPWCPRCSAAAEKLVDAVAGEAPPELRLVGRDGRSRPVRLVE